MHTAQHDDACRQVAAEARDFVVPERARFVVQLVKRVQQLIVVGRDLAALERPVDVMKDAMCCNSLDVCAHSCNPNCDEARRT